MYNIITVKSLLRKTKKQWLPLYVLLSTSSLATEFHCKSVFLIGIIRHPWYQIVPTWYTFGDIPCRFDLVTNDFGFTKCLRFAEGSIYDTWLQPALIFAAFFNPKINSQL